MPLFENTAAPLLMSKDPLGLVVPIPTSPAEVMRTRSVPPPLLPVLNASADEAPAPGFSRIASMLLTRVALLSVAHVIAPSPVFALTVPPLEAFVM